MLEFIAISIETALPALLLALLPLCVGVFHRGGAHTRSTLHFHCFYCKCEAKFVKNTCKARLLTLCQVNHKSKDKVVRAASNVILSEPDRRGALAHQA